MNIAEMADKEKSVMLARLCGWELVRREWKGALKVAWYNGDEQITPPQTIDIALWGENLEAMMCPDLYDPKNMSLAWRVLNWAMGQSGVYLRRDVVGVHTETVDIEFDLCLHEWFCEADIKDGLSVVDLPPADAQRTWLDKIITLAIEAGMVTK